MVDDEKELTSILGTNEGLFPLKNIIECLSSNIDKNHGSINLLIYRLDNDLTLPHVPTKGPEEEPAIYLRDNMRSLLDDKYKLSEITLPADQVSNAEHSYLKQLLSDVLRLRKFQYSRRQKNICLLDMVQEYEFLLSEYVLPFFEREISWLNHIFYEQLKSTIFAPKAHEASQVWLRYNLYLASIDQIKSACKRLIGLLLTCLDTKESFYLERKLICLSELQNLIHIKKSLLADHDEVPELNSK